MKVPPIVRHHEDKQGYGFLVLFSFSNFRVQLKDLLVGLMGYGVRAAMFLLLILVRIDKFFFTTFSASNLKSEISRRIEVSLEKVMASSRSSSVGMWRSK